jgi:hypothetical protein
MASFGPALRNILAMLVMMMRRTTTPNPMKIVTMFGITILTLQTE